MPDCLSPEQVVSDPTLSTLALPLRRRFFPLGFPLEIETNSADVILAANESWGRFSQLFDVAPVRFALGVTDSEAVPAELQSTFRSREHLMSVVADSENFFACDFNSGYAFGWITRAVASDRPFLRYRFLTAAVQMLIEQQAFAVLHGALISRDNCGVLLCGESFAGKSTLAYAAARSGWTYVSDDAAFLVRNRADRYAIGDSHTIRFREDARSLFPELADRLPVVRPNGKIGIEMFTCELPIQTAGACTIDHVVFLNRQPGCPPKLLRYPKDEALAAWESFASYGAESVRRAQKLCYRQLLGAEIWELVYSHFEDAVIRLDQLVGLGG